MIESPFFAPGTLPDLPPGRYYRTEVSSFKELASAAEDVISDCFAGYVLAGERQSIGIFIWGSASVMDRRVGPSVNGIGVNGTVEVTGNGTEVGKEFSMGPGESGRLVETS